MSDDRPYEHILGLRAIRSYRDEPLTEPDLARILEAARWTGSAKNRQDWSMVLITDRDRRHALAACGDFADPVRDAPVAVALVQEPGGYEFDTGRLAQNLMLAAAAIGVASCPVTLHREDDTRPVLGIPASSRCRYAVALGYPAEGTAPARFGGRKAFSEVVHRQRYGTG